MTELEKMQAILNRLAKIPMQQCKTLQVSAEEALAKCESRAELDFYYRKLVVCNV